LVILIAIADEGKGSLVILDELDGENISIFTEKLPEFFITICIWEVFNINVIESFS